MPEVAACYSGFPFFFYPDSSKQRAHLRKKISSNKTKLSSLLEKFNEEIAKKEVSHLQASVPEVMKGNFPWGNTSGKPCNLV